MADDDEEEGREEEAPVSHYAAPQGGGGRLNRERFRQELQNNPQLLAHVICVLAGESQGDGATAVFETMMNRAETLGQTLAQSSRRTFNGGRDGGYYAGYRNIISDPKLTERYMHSVMEGLSGSNYAHGATDNSSQDLAVRDADSGRFTLVATYGGNGKNGAPGVESFFIPGPRQPDYLAKYNGWRQNAGEFPPPTEGKVMAANSYQPNVNNMDPETYQRIWQQVEQANPQLARMSPQQRAQVMAQTMAYIAKTMPKQKAVGPYDAEENERKRSRESRADARFKASEERAKTRSEEKRAHDKAKELESEWKRAGARLAKAQTRLDRLENNRRQLMVNIGNALDKETKDQLKEEGKYYTDAIPKAQRELEEAEAAEKRAEKYFHAGGGSEKDDIRQLEDRTRAAYGDPAALKMIDEAAKADHLPFSTSQYLRENPVIEPKETQDRLTPTGEVKGPARPPSNFNNPYMAFKGPVDPNRPGDLSKTVPPLAAPATPPAAPAPPQQSWGEGIAEGWNKFSDWAHDVGPSAAEGRLGEKFNPLTHQKEGPSFYEEWKQHMADAWEHFGTKDIDELEKLRKEHPEEYEKKSFGEKFSTYMSPFGSAYMFSPFSGFGTLPTATGRLGAQTEAATGSPLAGEAVDIGAQFVAPGAIGKLGDMAKMGADAAKLRMRPMQGPTTPDGWSPRTPDPIWDPFRSGGRSAAPEAYRSPRDPIWDPYGYSSEYEMGPPGPEHGPTPPPGYAFVGPHEPMGPPAPMQRPPGPEHGPPKASSSDYTKQPSFSWPTYGEMPKGKGKQMGLGSYKRPPEEAPPVQGPPAPMQGPPGPMQGPQQPMGQQSFRFQPQPTPPAPPVRPPMPQGSGAQMGLGDQFGEVGPQFQPGPGHQYRMPLSGHEEIGRLGRDFIARRQRPPTVPQSPQLNLDFNAPRAPGAFAREAMGNPPAALPRPSTIYQYGPPPQGLLPGPAPMWQPPPMYSPQTFNQGQYMIGRHGNPYERVPEMATTTPQSSQVPTSRFKVPSPAEEEKVWAAHAERANKPKRKRTTKRKATSKDAEK